MYPAYGSLSKNLQRCTSERLDTVVGGNLTITGNNCKSIFEPSKIDSASRREPYHGVPQESGKFPKLFQFAQLPVARRMCLRGKRGSGGGGGGGEGVGEGEWGGGGGEWGRESTASKSYITGGQKVSQERTSQEEQNGANFSFIAPSSEELCVQKDTYG